MTILTIGRSWVTFAFDSKTGKALAMPIKKRSPWSARIRPPRNVRRIGGG